MRLFHPLARLLIRAQAVSTRYTAHLPAMACGKLDTPHFRALLTPDLLKLESLFRTNGYSFRLVGGVVRDLLLERHPKDIDLATECTPDEMLKLFALHGYRYIPTGLDHGTITVHTGSSDYEITTLRVDRVTDGRHAIVDFTTDWRMDALRRDLTINSMSLGFDGTLYDYFDGQKHLLEKKVVFVGDARTRIQEDYLRILRYFRFYGRIVPEVARHDRETLDAIRNTAEGLKGVAVERVWVEMAKILMGHHCPHLMKVMYDLGVARSIGTTLVAAPYTLPRHYLYLLPSGLPSDGNLEELDRVWTRSHLQGNSLQPVSLLVTLIHTVGEAYDIAHHWKLSNNEKRLGVFVVEHRMKAYNSDTNMKYYQVIAHCIAELTATPSSIPPFLS